MPPSALERLADRVGILPEYLDQSGTETRVTSDRTRVAILGALGIDAADEAACEAELARIAEEDRKTPLDPVAVVGEGPIIVGVRSPESFRDAAFELCSPWKRARRARRRAGCAPMARSRYRLFRLVITR